MTRWAPGHSRSVPSLEESGGKYAGLHCVEPGAEPFDRQSSPRLASGVVQRVEPWMSDDSIDGGARWNDAIVKALEETDFGIVCVTRANQTAPWLNFEAGAVAKKVGRGRVVPLLIDLPPTDLEGPLTAFQWRLLNEKDVRRLVHDLNKTAEEHVPERRWMGSLTRCGPS